MSNNDLQQALRAIGFKGSVRRNVPMHTMTSFRIGGPARYLLFPADRTDMHRLLTLFEARGLSCRMLGNGTNLLVADEGVPYPLIRLTRGFVELRRDTTMVQAEAGAPLHALLRFCAREGLSGLEPLAGIPGTVGGSIRMNAGSWGTEVADVLSSVNVITPSGEATTMQRHEINATYRDIGLSHRHIILWGMFSLRPADPAAIRRSLREFHHRKRNTQPLTLPSPGCIFKNPPGTSAGKLIDEAGGKGLRKGDAMVCPLHANFIVNAGAAQARDVMDLIDTIRDRVFRVHGITLELEVEILT